MAYTTIDNPKLYFQTKLYTGTGSSNAITLDGSENMQPDWVWIKCRDDSHNHQVFDSVRGVHKRMRTDTSGAETESSESLKSFDSDGFTLGTQANVNASADGDNSFASWNWKAGSGTSTNTSGNGPDTTINVNQTAGFSIVTWTGNGDAHTFGHGLGANADVVIVKNRESGSSSAWFVNHISVLNTKALYLNTTAVETTDAIWGNSAPDSTTFKFDTDNTDDFVAYCFAEKKGYSKFSSYVGNGDASGPYIHLGFSPAWVMIKKATGAANSWFIGDNKRSPFNIVFNYLLADTSDVDESGSGQERDFLSNGFKIRNSNNGLNTSGETYIFMAFAENPFVTSTGVPATAR